MPHGNIIVPQTDKVTGKAQCKIEACAPLPPPSSRLGLLPTALKSASEVRRRSAPPLSARNDGSPGPLVDPTTISPAISRPRYRNLFFPEVLHPLFKHSFYQNVLSSWPPLRLLDPERPLLQWMVRCVDGKNPRAGIRIFPHEGSISHYQKSTAEVLPATVYLLHPLSYLSHCARVDPGICTQSQHHLRRSVPPAARAYPVNAPLAYSCYSARPRTRPLCRFLHSLKA